MNGGGGVVVESRKRNKSSLSGKPHHRIVLDVVCLQKLAQHAERVIHLTERAEIITSGLPENVGVVVKPLREGVMRRMVGRESNICVFIVAGVVETAVNDLFINTTVNLPDSK